jgi:DNA-damage-inducible protein J
MASTNINVRTDSKLKADAQEVLSALGIDMSTLVNALLKQLTYRKAVPFELSIPSEQIKKKSRSELYGSMAGQIWMSDDFDEPIEDMEEYM